MIIIIIQVFTFIQSVFFVNSLAIPEINRITVKHAVYFPLMDLLYYTYKKILLNFSMMIIWLP